MASEIAQIERLEGIELVRRKIQGTDDPTALATVGGTLLLLLAVPVFAFGLFAVLVTPFFVAYLLVAVAPALAAAVLFTHPHSRRAMLLGAVISFLLATAAVLAYLRPASLVPSQLLLAYGAVAAGIGSFLTIQAGKAATIDEPEQR